MVPVFGANAIEAAVLPDRALEAVRDAFVAYARGEWSMPPKVYVPAYPAGDFRAMPVLGAGRPGDDLAHQRSAQVVAAGVEQAGPTIEAKLDP